MIEPSSASAAELVEQLKEIARLRAEGALTESEFEAVKARLSRTKPRLKKLVRRPQWTTSERGSPTSAH